MLLPQELEFSLERMQPHTWETFTSAYFPGPRVTKLVVARELGEEGASQTMESSRAGAGAEGRVRCGLGKATRGAGLELGGEACVAGAEGRVREARRPGLGTAVICRH